VAMKQIFELLGRLMCLTCTQSPSNDRSAAGAVHQSLMLPYVVALYSCNVSSVGEHRPQKPEGVGSIPTYYKEFARLVREVEAAIPTRWNYRRFESYTGYQVMEDGLARDASLVLIYDK
jgi:hypothetical protein